MSALYLTIWVTLGRLFNLSVPQISHHLLHKVVVPSPSLALRYTTVRKNFREYLVQFSIVLSFCPVSHLLSNFILFFVPYNFRMVKRERATFRVLSHIVYVPYKTPTWHISMALIPSQIGFLINTALKLNWFSPLYATKVIILICAFD